MCKCEYIFLPRRDYTVMDEVVDRELWERCRKGRMTSRSMEPAPRKREVKEEGGYQEWKRRRREGVARRREGILMRIVLSRRIRRRRRSRECVT